jgi:hypothetical protein
MISDAPILRDANAFPLASPTSRIGSSKYSELELLDELQGYASLAFVAHTPTSPIECFDKPWGTIASAGSTTVTTTWSPSPQLAQLSRTVLYAPQGVPDTWATIRIWLLHRFSELSVAEYEPTYEPDPQAVNWDRLRRLRGIGARESADLYDWYAQKQE